MDENQQAREMVEHATAHPSPLDRFTEIIEQARDLLDQGEQPSTVAARLWPRVVEIVPVARTAAELGRRGGKKGGKARAEKLTPEERSEIARKAARARWSSRTSDG